MVYISHWTCIVLNIIQIQHLPEHRRAKVDKWKQTDLPRQNDVSGCRQLLATNQCGKNSTFVPCLFLRSNEYIHILSQIPLNQGWDSQFTRISQGWAHKVEHKATGSEWIPKANSTYMPGHMIPVQICNLNQNSRSPSLCKITFQP